jgi:hypothetical protein
MKYHVVFIYLSVANLIIYLLVICNLLSVFRQSLFYVAGVYIPLAFICIALFNLFVFKKHIFTYCLIVIINTLVFVGTCMYLQNALIVR